MRLFVILVALFPAIISAQSVIPQAVDETINLAPRIKKGEILRYEAQIRVQRFDSLGVLEQSKRDNLAYSQYCNENTPENGVDYLITIDSFTVGTYTRTGKYEGIMQVVKQLDGLSYDSKIRRNIPAKDGCYDLGITLHDSLRFVEVREFLEYYLYLRLIEQLRFAAGTQLSKIGDTSVVRFPDPICLRVNRVLNRFVMPLKPQVLEISGLTKYAGHSCAIVDIRETVSPFEIGLWAGEGISIPGTGQTTIAGQFLVSLSNGAIVAASIRERADTNLIGPQNQPISSRVIRDINLRLLN